jgi:hypothetical protein
MIRFLRPHRSYCADPKIETDALEFLLYFVAFARCLRRSDREGEGMSNVEWRIWNVEGEILHFVQNDNAIFDIGFENAAGGDKDPRRWRGGPLGT